MRDHFGGVVVSGGVSFGGVWCLVSLFSDTMVSVNWDPMSWESYIAKFRFFLGPADGSGS
jgi:hypothetical protein